MLKVTTLLQLEKNIKSVMYNTFNTTKSALWLIKVLFKMNQLLMFKMDVVFLSR